MAWLPSHQELREHPKTRRAARRLGIAVPQMVGHLHFLWWWALDHAADGDLGRFDAEDIAEAAGWEDDPEEFSKALMDCGPGGGPGFIDQDGKLHDWDEYGGKYEKRVAAGRKAAEVRWQNKGNADPDAVAMRSHSPGNAEERRGEEKTRNVAEAATVRQVFEAWLESTGKHPTRTKLDANRRGFIRKALRSYPLEDVLDAVRGWKNIPHNRGENDTGTIYNDLELILRNSANIERFRDAARSPGPAGRDVNGIRER